MTRSQRPSRLLLPQAPRPLSEAVSLGIAHTWDGAPVGPEEAARAEICRVTAAGGEGLLLRVEAPFHGDPPPEAAPGPTPELWEHEVVEVFLAGPGDPETVPYLEVELSPWGYHLVLQLEGVRRVVAAGLPIDYAFRRPEEAAGTAAGNWLGEALIPAAYLPPGPWRANAYALHGEGTARRYLAAYPVPPTPERPDPDFHQPSLFRPLDLPAPGPTA